MDTADTRRIACLLPDLRLSWSALLACLMLVGLPAMAAENDDARAAESIVGEFHAALVEVAALAPQVETAGRAAALAAVVAATHDLSRMGRLTVPRRYWREAQEAEREAYLAAFERFTLMTYASRFASIGPATLEIAGSNVVGDDAVDVHAVLHRPDGNGDVSMDYSLRRSDGAFRIVSIVADGGNELNIMASEHAAVLEAGTMADVIALLEARIESL